MWLHHNGALFWMVCSVCRVISYFKIGSISEMGLQLRLCLFVFHVVGSQVRLYVGSTHLNSTGGLLRNFVWEGSWLFSSREDSCEGRDKSDVGV